MQIDENPMGRATQIAERVEKLNNDMIALGEGLTDVQLKQQTAPEHWSLGVLAHHIATSNPAVAGMAAVIAAGHPSASHADRATRDGWAAHRLFMRAPIVRLKCRAYKSNLGRCPSIMWTYALYT